MDPGAAAVGVGIVAELVMSRYARKQANTILRANKPPLTQRCHTVFPLPFTQHQDDWHDSSMRVKSCKRMPEPRHGRLGGGGVNEREQSSKRYRGVAPSTRSRQQGS